MKLPAIVLVSPRNPKNIGAVARVMANFGFSDLRIVSPHPPVWEEARITATDAENLLKKTVVFDTLAQAVSDRTRVWATSCLKGRRPVSAEALPGFRAAASEAVVFGQEKRGLRGEDLAFCDGLLTIPTMSDALSMNLAQAVGVVCYELGIKRQIAPAAPRRILSNELEILITRCQAALAKLGYRPALSPAARESKVRSLLRRRGVAPAEAGFLREVLRRLEERLSGSS